MRRTLVIACVALLALLFMGLNDTASAQDNALDRIVELYRTKAQSWEATLGRLALSLFWLLAGIEFAWANLRLAFRGADLSEWLTEVVNQIFFLGFFLLLLTNSATWSRNIVDSFRQAAVAAAQANGVAAGVAPSDIFNVGQQIAGKFVESTSLWSPAASLGLLIAGLVIIVCFALITAFMILALVESYVVISASVLFMGFGGSHWTKDLATKTLTYAVSVGAKLFIMQLLVSLGAQVFDQLGRDIATTNSSLFVIIGSAIVMLAITKTVPEMVQGLINGASVGSGGALVSAVAGAVTGAAAAAIGGGMAIRAADQLAGEQLQDAKEAGHAPKSGAGQQAWRVGMAVANLGRFAVGNVGDRISGKGKFATRFGQSTLEMQREADELKEARKARKRKADSDGN